MISIEQIGQGGTPEADRLEQTPHGRHCKDPVL